MRVQNTQAQLERHNNPANFRNNELQKKQLNDYYIFIIIYY